MKSLIPSKSGVAGITWQQVAVFAIAAAGFICAAYFLDDEQRQWVQSAVSLVGGYVLARMRSTEGEP